MWKRRRWLDEGKDIKLSWVSLCGPLPAGGEISVAALLLVCKTHTETQRMCTFSTPEEFGGGAELLLDVFRDQIMVAKSYNTTMNEPHRTIPTSEAVSCFLSLPLYAKLLCFGSKKNQLLFFLSLSS